jgi:hypothetical protein
VAAHEQVELPFWFKVRTERGYVKCEINEVQREYLYRIGYIRKYQSANIIERPNWATVKKLFPHKPIYFFVGAISSGKTSLVRKDHRVVDADDLARPLAWSTDYGWVDVNYLVMQNMRNWLHADVEKNWEEHNLYFETRQWIGLSLLGYRFATVHNVESVGKLGGILIDVFLPSKSAWIDNPKHRLHDPETLKWHKRNAKDIMDALSRESTHLLHVFDDHTKNTRRQIALINDYERGGLKDY